MKLEYNRMFLQIMKWLQIGQTYLLWHISKHRLEVLNIPLTIKSDNYKLTVIISFTVVSYLEVMVI